MADKPDAAFHEKKDKNKKEYNFGKGQKLKMNKAALLLMQTDYSIKKISLMLNFDNQYYFSRAFKHIYGVSPQNYREKH